MTAASPAKPKRGSTAPWAWTGFEPELRENRGEVEAARAGTLPKVITLADLRGDLHMHTTETDGKDDLTAMAQAAHRLGREYIAITDHSQALAMANGLDEKRALAHAARVRALNGRFANLTLLAGIECDILSDGRSISPTTASPSSTSSSPRSIRTSRRSRSR